MAKIYTCWGLIVLYHAVVIVPGSRVGISFLCFCAMGMCFNISGQVSFGFACKSTLSYFIVPLVLVTLQGTNISHLGKRNIIFKLASSADTLVSGSVNRINIFVQNNPNPKNRAASAC